MGVPREWILEAELTISYKDGIIFIKKRMFMVTLVLKQFANFISLLRILQGKILANKKGPCF